MGAVAEHKAIDALGVRHRQCPGHARADVVADDMRALFAEQDDEVGDVLRDRPDPAVADMRRTGRGQR